MNKRNWGIELLRSVSMLMVVILHILGPGGVIEAQAEQSSGYFIFQLLKLCCFCAVDCFGLISGFVSGYSLPVMPDSNSSNHPDMSSPSHKFHRLMRVWRQVVFYSAGLMLVYRIWKPEMVGNQDLFWSFFPVLSKRYWYFTAYFGIELLLAYLEIPMHKFSRKQAKTMLFALILSFSCLPLLSQETDIFVLRGGYSCIWLLILYLIGAALHRVMQEDFEIQKSQESPELKKKKSGFKFLLGYLLFVFLAFGSAFLFGYESKFISYNSPVILLSAICLLLWFQQMSFEKRHWTSRAIQALAPLSFGVYLIHTHPMVWNEVLLNHFAFCGPFPVWKSGIIIIFFALGLYLFCSGIECIRLKIFRLCYNLHHSDSP